MQLTHQIENDQLVIRFRGKIQGNVSLEQRDAIDAAVENTRSVLLDFSRATGFSNLGLRKLLMFFRHLSALGVELSTTGVPDRILDTIAAAGFLSLFEKSNRVTSATFPTEPNPRIDIYPTHRHGQFALRAGNPTLPGATPVLRGVNFSVFSHHGTACTLALFHSGEAQPYAEIPFPDEFRVGDIFTMTVFDLDSENLEYCFRVDGPYEPENGHRFDSERYLLDPTATAVAGREVWGEENGVSQSAAPFRSRIVPDDFDWEGDRPLQIPMEDLVVYEMHVRGFTKSPSSNVAFPGTFAGLREKIPYLKDLGINCVELMPVFEFDELENHRYHPDTGELLLNYWGYSNIAFCAPKAGYAATGPQGMQADEFKALIKELHQNGIEVILDVVFNHTAEGNENGPTISFRGLDNRIYYMLTPDGQYFNFSGCGNTLNCNHPVVRNFVRNCLRYWVSEYHIDGFRFDLASILGRDSQGTPLPNPPLLEALAMDPILSNTKLIAEAWDAGGLYQVGTFPAYGRWAEWNGKYRDCVRKFLKGDMGQVSEMASRLLGSPDVYPTRGPAASVNFVTCHDGFTLADLVSYNEKHNLSNGEDNRDGSNDNHSWNCGVEGPTDDDEINRLRLRQSKNALTTLMLSRGVPMLLMGDECGRTQDGNNNTYCHDSPLTWFDWNLPGQNSDLFRFCRQLIKFRRVHPALRRRGKGNNPLEGDGRAKVTWHGTKPFEADWAGWSRILAFDLSMEEEGQDDALYVAMNMHSDTVTFELPEPPSGRVWRQFLNTSADSPNDICEPGQECPLSNDEQLPLVSRSIVVLVAS